MHFKERLHSLVYEIKVFISHTVEIGYSVRYSFNLVHIDNVYKNSKDKVRLFRSINQRLQRYYVFKFLVSFNFCPVIAKLP